jgi:secreted trypsin-like serine protease
MQAESQLSNQNRFGADRWVFVMAIPGIGHGEGTGSYITGDSGSPVLLGGTDIALGVHSWGPNAHAWTAASRVDTARCSTSSPASRADLRQPQLIARL